MDLVKLSSPNTNDLGCPPSQDAIVTTRIVTFLVGDPNLNLHLPQASCEGGVTQPMIHDRCFSRHRLVFFGAKKSIELYTLPETNIAPENGPSQKETIVFQPSIFRCENVSFRECRLADSCVCVCVFPDHHLGD